MRSGLVQLISTEKDVLVVGQFEDAGSAFGSIEKIKPDVAIIDLSLKASSGLELVKSIKAAYPKLIMLVLSMYDEAIYAERVLRAGASGYVMKQEATEKVLVALRKVLAGGIYLSERMSSKFMHQLVGGARVNNGGGSLIERLSDRELEVFGLIGEGRGTRQMGPIAPERQDRRVAPRAHQRKAQLAQCHRTSPSRHPDEAGVSSKRNNFAVAMRTRTSDYKSLKSSLEFSFSSFFLDAKA